MDAEDFVFDDLTSDDEASPPASPSTAADADADANAAQSPWELASYTESVAEEHARRSTTSIDDKISRARKQRPLPLPIDEEAAVDGELTDRQVGFTVSRCLVR